MAFWYSVMIGIGVAAWVYAKFTHRLNNPQSSLIAAGVSGLIAFIVFLTLLKTVFHY